MNRRYFLNTVILTLAIATLPKAATAHALPGTEIEFSRNDMGLKLVIAIPLAELILALRFKAGAQSHALVKNHSDALRQYILEHVSLKTEAGEVVTVLVTGIKTGTANDHHVGDYETVIVTLEGAAAQTQPLLLKYDAVIHRVATHRATVRSNQNGSLKKIGSIKYDFAGKIIAPLEIR